jgi:hypothetical protein
VSTDLVNPGRIAVHDIHTGRKLLVLIVGDGGNFDVIYHSNTISLRVDEPEVFMREDLGSSGKFIVTEHPQYLEIKKKTHATNEQDSRPQQTPAPTQPLTSPVRQGDRPFSTN